MTEATFVILASPLPLFMYRLCVGPSLADRVVALNGLVLVGMGAIATHAAATGVGVVPARRSSRSPSSDRSATA